MPIRLVLFDMDDVLCDYRVEDRVAALARLSGRRPEAIREAIWESDYFEQSDTGAWTAGQSLAEFGRRIGHPFSRQDWVEARRIAMVPFPDMLALVARLKQAAKVAVLTNNDPLVAETLPELFPALPALFDGNVFVSSQFGCAKPDPEVFRACCRRMEVLPQETFFTDDRPENVDGARRAGLAAHVFRGEPGLRAALQAAGVAA
ncbi:MAG: HAD family phosphatase [Alsobacter sp.]